MFFNHLGYSSQEIPQESENEWGPMPQFPFLTETCPKVPDLQSFACTTQQLALGTRGKASIICDSHVTSDTLAAPHEVSSHP